MTPHLREYQAAMMDQNTDPIAAPILAPTDVVERKPQSYAEWKKQSDRRVLHEVAEAEADPEVALILAALPGAKIQEVRFRSRDPEFGPHLRVWNRWTEEYEEPEEAPRHFINEQWFGAFGVPAAKNGWAVFPQERDGQRKPIYIDTDYERIRISKYHDVAPDLKTVEHWRIFGLNDNMAIILGRASGNVFAVDIDVLDEDLSRAILHAAFRTMGRTEFVRIGKAPKRMLFYRAESPDTIPAFRREILTEADGQTPSEHMIEILGQGRAATVYGLHHQTGQRFIHAGERSPVNGRPEDVPIATAEQLATFFDAVDAQVRAFVKKAPRAIDFNEGIDLTDAGEVRIPTVRNEAANWATDPVTGLVTDGRESFLFSLVRATVAANAAAARTPAGRTQIGNLIIDAFKARTQPKTSWTGAHLLSQVTEKLDRQILALKDGRLRPLKVSQPIVIPEGTLPAAAAARQTVGFDTLSLIPRIRRLRGNLKAAHPLSPAADFDPACRALPVDPADDSKRVSKALRAALEVAINQAMGPGGEKTAQLLKVPTGGGKTSAFVGLTADIRAGEVISALAAVETDEPLGTLFCAPTHMNTKEVDARAKAAGLRSMVYGGKLQLDENGKPLCAEHVRVRPLQEKGLSTSGLCKSVRKGSDGEQIVEHCEHFKTCPFIAQQEKALTCDLVIAPHAYLGLDSKLPKALKSSKLVVVDESILGALTHDVSMPIDTLKLPRKLPKGLKVHADESASTPELCVAELERLRVVATDALMADRDVAAAVLAMEHSGVSNAPGYARRAVERCLHVCAAAMRAEQELTPKMHLNEILKRADQVDDRSVRQEWRFWKLVEDRLEDLEAGLACGDTDHRIRRVRKNVHLSWRSPMALADRPTIFLDATANEKILTKLVRKPVETQIIDAPIRQVTILVPDQTYSKSWLLAREGDDHDAQLMKSARTARVVKAIHTICMRHAHGAVVAALPMAMEKVLRSQANWPKNLLWMHYGNTRGLDYAKDAVAMITCGELNAQPIQIDGIVAALTYDDAEPERPMVGPDGKSPPYSSTPVVSQLRDGRDVSIETYRVAGSMAAAVQTAIRDEDLVQCWGRLRPVHRSIPGVVYHLGRTVPAGTIVDDLCSMSELVGSDADIALMLGASGGQLAESQVQYSLKTAHAFASLCDEIDAGGALAKALSVKQEDIGERVLVTRFAADEAAPDLAKALVQSAKPMGQEPPVAAVIEKRGDRYVNERGVDLGSDPLTAELYDRVSVLPALPEEAPVEPVEVTPTPSIVPTFSERMGSGETETDVLGLRMHGRPVDLAETF